MLLTLKVNSTDKKIEIEAFSNSELIATYFMQTRIQIGEKEKYMSIPLLAFWAAIDLGNIKEILFDFALSTEQRKYISKMFKLCFKTYSQLHSLKIPKLIFSKEQNSKKWDVIEEHGGYLGYSGGRDSHLSKLILDKLEIKYEKYKVCFENDLTNELLRVDYKINHSKTYDIMSISKCSTNSYIVPLHQADDVHLTFIAPLLSNTKKAYDSVFVGLPLEVIESSNGLNYVPTETYESIIILEEFIKSLGHKKFKVLSIIAGLHSLSVYKMIPLIEKNHATTKLDSCWYSYSFRDNQQCGCCIKCQRVKYIDKVLYKTDIMTFAPSLPIEPSFLFSTNLKINQDNCKKFENIVVDNQKIRKFHGQYHDTLLRLYKSLDWDVELMPSFSYENLRHLDTDELTNRIQEILRHNIVDTEENPEILNHIILPMFSYVSPDNYSSLVKSRALIEALKNDPSKIKDIFTNYDQYTELFNFWLDLSNRTNSIYENN